MKERVIIVQYNSTVICYNKDEYTRVQVISRDRTLIQLYNFLKITMYKGIKT